MSGTGYSTLDEILGTVKSGQLPKQFLLNSLITSNVYVICTPNALKAGLMHDGILEVYAERAADGSPVVPVFTTVRELDSYAPVKVDHYKINGLELFRLINGVSAVLNPKSLNRKVTAEEITELVEDSDKPSKPWEYEFVNDGSVEYSRPSMTPESLKKLLMNFFSKNSNVEKAFIVGMTRKDEEEKLLIIVDAQGSYRKLFTETGRLITKTFGPSDVRFISYERPDVQDVANRFTAFYIKNSRLKSDRMVF